MTITSIATQIDYTGNGATVAFAIPFPFDTSADIKVTQDGTEITTGFTITGGGGGTGTCTFDTAPATDVLITLLDDPELIQDHDYTDNDSFPAESHEQALDRLTRIAKRHDNRINLGIRFPDGTGIDPDDLELNPDNYASKYLAFDSTGKPTPAALSAETMTQAIIGELLYPITPGETAAGVTPTFYFYVPGKRKPGDIRRYNGAVDGVTNDKAAIMEGLDSEGTAYIPGTSLVSSAVQLLDSGLRIYGHNQSDCKIITTSNAINAIEVGNGTDKIYRCAIEDLQISCTAGSFGTANGGLRLMDNCGPEHSYRRLLIQGFKNNLYVGDANFSAIFDTVACSAGDRNFYFAGVNNIINMVLLNCYSYAPTTIGLLAAACRNFQILSMNFGSTGAPFVDVRVNSYGIAFQTPNFELDSGSFAAGADLFKVDSSQVQIYGGKFQAPAAAGASAYLLAAQGTADLQVFGLKVLSEGANIIHMRTADTGRIRLYGNNGTLTTKSEASSVRILDVDAAVDRAPIASGTASVSSGDNIAHGLGYTPGSAEITEIITDGTTITRRIVATTLDNTNIKVRALNTTVGTQDFGGPWTVKWRAYA